MPPRCSHLLHQQIFQGRCRCAYDGSKQFTFKVRLSPPFLEATTFCPRLPMTFEGAARRAILFGGLLEPIPRIICFCQFRSFCYWIGCDRAIKDFFPPPKNKNH